MLTLWVVDRDGEDLYSVEYETLEDLETCWPYAEYQEPGQYAAWAGSRK